MATIFATFAWPNATLCWFTMTRSKKTAMPPVTSWCDGRWAETTVSPALRSFIGTRSAAFVPWWLAELSGSQHAAKASSAETRLSTRRQAGVFCAKHRAPSVTLLQAVARLSFASWHKFSTRCTCSKQTSNMYDSETCAAHRTPSGTSHGGGVSPGSLTIFSGGNSDLRFRRMISFMDACATIPRFWIGTASSIVIFDLLPLPLPLPSFVTMKSLCTDFVSSIAKSPGV
mmetsp:Transcript_27973/g.56346  ORF Transcript_27973/g.56346 Transcript_27973/m.56346 type:complete len:229 (-) Transcript_27973:148-834(-)